MIKHALLILSILCLLLTILIILTARPVDKYAKCKIANQCVVDDWIFFVIKEGKK